MMVSQDFTEQRERKELQDIQEPQDRREREVRSPTLAAEVLGRNG